MGAPDPREAASRELARHLATPEGRRVARLLQATGTLVAPLSPSEPAPPPPAETPAPPAAASRPISIWQPCEGPEGLVFERPEPGPLGDHFATVRELRPRTGPLPRRICFFGESVAAGYLYAPHLTPARLLSDQLRAIAGPDAWEVIDLARTNETLGSLAATVDAALQLAPDLLVLFAGNNWTLLETPEVSPWVPAVRARQELAAALRAEGLPGPARLARRRLALRAEAALSAIALRARQAGIPVVLVIPEVNLADWETRQPVAWLPGDGTARWYEAYGRATAALGGGDWAAAEAAAWEMIDLDGGTCPTPFRLLARALEGQGRAADARDACLSEIDATHLPLLAFLAAPLAGSAARAILAGAAREHGWAAVDLREVFAAWTGSLLPGRRLFLDYCHLTAEGMQVAMATVAEQVLRRTGSESPTWRDLLTSLPAPAVSPEAEATARFAAALHSAHRLVPVTPKAPLLTWWCEQALAASPGIADTFLDLAEARTAPGPAVLTAAQRRNHASPYRLLLQHGLRWEGLDADVLEAARDALAAVGHRGAKEIEQRLRDAFRLPPEGRDLAATPFYLDEPLARFYPDVLEHADLPGRATLRAPWPDTTFLLGGDGRDVELQATARLPAVAGAPGRKGRVEVLLDGAPVGSFGAGEPWQRTDLVLPGARLGPGLHRLTLRWPPPPPVGEAALESAIRRLEEGIEADLHPVFGEVAALRARPAG
jgi:hypothetical protein